MKVLVATHNRGKLAEFESLLAPLGVQVVSAAAAGLTEPEETGATFGANARLKAVAAAKAAGMAAIADDSGLCVAAMGGGPGVLSARYAAGDYEGAFGRIIAACERAGEWRARFVCALCWAGADGGTATFVGQADGVIGRAASGDGGFGYDPIFVPVGYEASYAELGAVKQGISHRARAVAQLVRVLEGTEGLGHGPQEQKFFGYFFSKK
jgi:XTP/dITP diphosphohydrolase